VKSLIIWQNIGSITKAEQSPVAIIAGPKNISLVARGLKKT
jgi:hypothetical protein